MHAPPTPRSHVPRISALLVSTALAAIFWFAAPLALGRELEAWEWALFAAALIGPWAWWRRRRIRREREYLENLRDSALW